MPATLNDLLSAQRAAFNAELPVTLESRRDRLGRVARMLADEGERFCTAMSEDFRPPLARTVDDDRHRAVDYHGKANGQDHCPNG